MTEAVTITIAEDTTTSSRDDTYTGVSGEFTTSRPEEKTVTRGRGSEGTASSVPIFYSIFPVPIEGTEHKRHYTQTVCLSDGSSLSNFALQKQEDYLYITPHGVGGNSRTYLATQTGILKREVVIKVLNDFSNLYLRAYAEAITGARLTRSIHVAQTLDVMLTTKGQLAIVTERLDPLPEQKLRPPEVLRYAQHIGSAIDYIHSLGGYHGDVKPLNTGVFPHDTEKPYALFDFGETEISDDTNSIAQSRNFTYLYCSSDLIKKINGSSATFSDRQTGDIAALAATVYALLKEDRRPIWDQDQEMLIQSENVPISANILEVLNNAVQGMYASCAEFTSALSDNINPSDE